MRAALRGCSFGQVFNRNDKPVAEAIVYLKNIKTLVVKTYIAGQDGEYRFPALSPMSITRFSPSTQASAAASRLLAHSTAAGKRESI